MRAIGLMSGTSMDGIDAAIIDTDGYIIEDLGPTSFRAYRQEERHLLRLAAAECADWSHRQAMTRPITENVSLAERILTEAHAALVEQLLQDAGLRAKDIDVIGLHGQTMYHRPEKGITVQLGDGAELAARCAIDVVYDFRSADIHAGGQGAPLVPIFHEALARHHDWPMPMLFVNIGGVANVSWLNDDALIAFDTGPGNALIDDWMQTHYGVSYDEDGRCAARGNVDQRRLRQWLAHPYFLAPPPKSLDRNEFHHFSAVEMSPEDGAASLTAFTAHALVAGAKMLAEEPRQWVISGGGAHNSTLLAMLAARIDAEGYTAPIRTAASLGIDGDFVEAQAFAYLAVRSCCGLPITFPGTTGVRAASTGGRLVHATA